MSVQFLKWVGSVLIINRFTTIHNIGNLPKQTQVELRYLAHFTVIWYS